MRFEKTLEIQKMIRVESQKTAYLATPVDEELLDSKYFFSISEARAYLTPVGGLVTDRGRIVAVVESN